MSGDRRSRGQAAEERAARYLERRGYRLLSRNYRTRRGEIDLIAEQRGEIVFVEVRSRADERHGSPAESVDWRKRRKLIRAAQAYLFEIGGGDHPCRFDVITLVTESAGIGEQVLHYENAFDGEGRPTGAWSRA